MKKYTKIFFSIIIPCYNGANTIKRTISSILEQSYNNYEVIIVNDASTDDSLEIIKKHISNDSRFKILNLKKNIGLSRARNSGLQYVCGKYICFLDVDDFWEKEKIETQVKFLEKNKSFMMVYSNYFTIDEIKKKKFIQNNFDLPYGKITNNILNKYTVGILTVCLKKSIFEKYNFEKKYNVIGDFDFFVRLSRNINVGCIQKPLANYRIHSDNYSKKKLNLYIKELKNWINENDKELSDNGFSLLNQKYFLFKLRVKKYLFYLGV